MTDRIRSRKGVADTPPYKPGLPIELVAREYGIDADSIVKLASNENPLGPSPKAMKAISAAVKELHRYPDGGAWELTQALSKKHHLPADCFITGNGSNEILELLGQAFLEPGTNAVMGEYPFVVYPLVTTHFGAEIKCVPMPNLEHDLNAMLEAIDENTRIVFIASPNNPTPGHVDADEMIEFAEKLPDHVILCFDSAYGEYLDDQVDLIPLINKGKNIVVTHTFSKIYGLAGLRVGYAYGPKEIVSLLLRTRQPFSVNSLALEGALAALGDQAFVKLSKSTNTKGLKQLETGLSELGLETVIGKTNFILVKVNNPKFVCEELLKMGVIVRSMLPFSLDGMIRVSVGSEPENEKFLEAIKGILNSTTI